jgi:hypothetical protein
MNEVHRTTDELNALRLRLHNFGLANWVGRSTTTHAQMLRVAQACVDALDQFDRYEAEIERLNKKLAPGGMTEPNPSSCPESGTGAASPGDVGATLGKRKERCPHGVSHLNVCTKCD